MSLADFHCDTFDLRLEFTLENFDKDAFLKAANIDDETEYVDEDGDLVLRLSLGSHSDPPRDHAHLTIMLRNEESGTATLSYHQAGPKPVEVDDQTPTLEDCAQWLSGFFRTDDVRGKINAFYTFGDEFKPTIPLPFPLVASSPGLAGLKVSGLSLDYPEDSPIESVILQRDKKNIYVFLHMMATASLKEFDLFRELGNMDETVTSLVAKDEKQDGRDKKV